MPTPCAYCSNAHATSATFSEARLIDLPDGRSCHFRCLRVWLSEDAVDRWFGKMPALERRALMLRIGLPVESARMPGVKEVAPKVGRSFPWVSNLQREAMRTFFSKSAAVRRKPNEEQLRRDAANEVKQILSNIVEMAHAADDRLEAAIPKRVVVKRARVAS